MHGINNDTHNMDMIKVWVEELLPGVYVRNCEVGNGKKDSIFMPINEQIDGLAQCIKDDKMLQNGFIGLGYSQGGYLLRGFLQKYNQPRMKRLVTLSSPLSGYFCGRHYQCVEGLVIPEFLNNLAPAVVYSEFGQNLIGGAGYWRDPYNFDMYTERSTSLSLLDNVKEVNETYRQNFASLDMLVMFGSPKDGVFCPWNSAWFGGFLTDDETLHDMTERFEYKQDLFGLRTLNEQGKVKAFDSHTKHEDYAGAEELIKTQVVQWLKD